MYVMIVSGAPFLFWVGNFTVKKYEFSKVGNFRSALRKCVPDCALQKCVPGSALQRCVPEFSGKTQKNYGHFVAHNLCRSWHTICAGSGTQFVLVVAHNLCH